MEDNNSSGSCCGNRLAKLLKDFSNGCVTENNDAKAEIKPLVKTPKDPETILIELKYSKSPLK